MKIFLITLALVALTAAGPAHKLKKRDIGLDLKKYLPPATSYEANEIQVPSTSYGEPIKATLAPVAAPQPIYYSAPAVSHVQHHVEQEIVQKDQSYSHVASAPAAAPAQIYLPAPAPQPIYKSAPAPQPIYKPAPAPQPIYKPAPAPQQIYLPAPAPQPIYKPAPAPQPIYLPAPEPVYQPAPAPAPAPQPIYLPAPEPAYQPAPAPAPAPQPTYVSAPAPAPQPIYQQPAPVYETYVANVESSNAASSSYSHQQATGSNGGYVY